MDFAFIPIFIAMTMTVTKPLFLGWKPGDKNNNTNTEPRPDCHSSKDRQGNMSHKSRSPGIKFKAVTEPPKSPNPILSFCKRRESKSPSLSLGRSRSKSPNPSMSSLTLSIASTSRMAAYNDNSMRGDLTRRFSERRFLHPARERNRLVDQSIFTLLFTFTLLLSGLASNFPSHARSSTREPGYQPTNIKLFKYFYSSVSSPVSPVLAYAVEAVIKECVYV